MANITYNITVAIANNSYGYGNKYHIDNVVGASIQFTSGNTYKFDQSSSTNNNHSFRFSTTPNGTHAAGVEYTTGVKKVGVAGTSGSYVEISVTDSTPTLYYCSNHSGMGNNVPAGIDSIAPNIIPSPTPTVSVTPTRAIARLPDIPNEVANCRGQAFIRECSPSEISVGNNSNINSLVWTDTNIDVFANDILFLNIRGCICNESSTLQTGKRR